MDENKTFEQKLKELENLVIELQSNNKTLNETVEMFNEGIVLINDLKSELDIAENKVKVLITNDKGYEINNFNE